LLLGQGHTTNWFVIELPVCVHLLVQINTTLRQTYIFDSVKLYMNTVVTSDVSPRSLTHRH